MSLRVLDKKLNLLPQDGLEFNENQTKEIDELTQVNLDYLIAVSDLSLELFESQFPDILKSQLDDGSYVGALVQAAISFDFEYSMENKILGFPRKQAPINAVAQFKKNFDAKKDNSLADKWFYAILEMRRTLHLIFDAQSKLKSKYTGNQLGWSRDYIAIQSHMLFLGLMELQTVLKVEKKARQNYTKSAEFSRANPNQKIITFETTRKKRLSKIKKNLVKYNSFAINWKKVLFWGLLGAAVTVATVLTLGFAGVIVTGVAAAGVAVGAGVSASLSTAIAVSLPVGALVVGPLLWAATKFVKHIFENVRNWFLQQRENKLTSKLQKKAVEKDPHHYTIPAKVVPVVVSPPSPTEPVRRASIGSTPQSSPGLSSHRASQFCRSTQPIPEIKSFESVNTPVLLSP